MNTGSHHEKAAPYTSRQRLAEALAHRAPDRVPFDLAATKVTGISIKAYRRYLEYAGLPHLDPQPQVGDEVQQLAGVSEAFLQHLQVDTRGLIPGAGAGWKKVYKRVGDYIEFTDEWGLPWRMPAEDGHYFDLAGHPLAEAEGMEIFASYPWPDPQDAGRLAGVQSTAQAIAASEEKQAQAWTMHGLCAGILEMALRLRGYEQFFLDLALAPETACGLLDRLAEMKMAFWEAALDIMGEHLLVAVEADDLGTQTSLLISPDMYRAYLKPRHKKVCSFIKRKCPHVRIFLHSCGAIYPLIPGLIEAGFDILNPVQVSAEGMQDTARLKKEFGDALVFWGGGVDTQRVLPYGTPAEVRDEVKRRLDDLAPGGGFVFSTVHNIQADVPPENLEAMWETFATYNRY